ncbi:MAG: hypothetical protein PHI18_03395 [bacterium]|nr:hypothetical protein [bacterium]
MICVVTLLIAAAVELPAQAGGALDTYPALMDTLMGGNYAAAESLCVGLETAHPGHPAGSYARATVCYTRMIDMEDTLGRAEFFALSDECLSRCDDFEKQQREGGVVLDYLRGSAYSTQGLLHLHEGNILNGIRLLMSARNLFDAVIEAQPEFDDAYLGRGAYRVSVARYASMLKWLPVVPDEQSGWDDLWRAVERSRFSRYSALSAMVWFAIEDRNLTLADSICALGLARFPDSRGFLWPKMALEVRQERWEDADATAARLLAQYLEHPFNNGYETIGLYWRRMVCADHLGHSDDAAQFARAGLATYRTPDVERRRRDKLREMNERVGTAGE